MLYPTELRERGRDSTSSERVGKATGGVGGALMLPLWREIAGWEAVAGSLLQGRCSMPRLVVIKGPAAGKTAQFSGEGILGKGADARSSSASPRIASDRRQSDSYRFLPGIPFLGRSMRRGWRGFREEADGKCHGRMERRVLARFMNGCRACGRANRRFDE